MVSNSSLDSDNREGAGDWPIAEMEATIKSETERRMHFMFIDVAVGFFNRNGVAGGLLANPFGVASRNPSFEIPLAYSGT